MMKKGVSFIIPGDSGNYLYQILKGINIKNFYWYIEDQSEVLDSSFNESFFKKNYYSGDEFLNKILENHYIIFMKLQACFHENDFSEIHSYKDFYNSNCRLLILIYDCKFVEIFIKDQIHIEILYQQAIECHFSEVKYITDKNNSRIQLDI